MSYSLDSLCWNCHNREKCTDHVILQDAIVKIHENCLDEENGPHCGAGSVILRCHNFNNNKSTEERRETKR